MCISMYVHVHAHVCMGIVSVRTTCMRTQYRPMLHDIKCMTVVNVG